MGSLNNTGIEISRDPETNMVRLRTVFNQVTMSEATAAKLAVLLFPDWLDACKAALADLQWLWRQAEAGHNNLGPNEYVMTRIADAINKAEGN